MLIPGGIGDFSVLYIVERERDDSFRFCVINTDVNNGLDYHLSTAEQSPKIKYQTIITIPNIKPKKMLDDTLWGFIFKLATCPSKHNNPGKLYNLIIPYLTDKPLEHVSRHKPL
jgi:hypothetical protein